MNVPLLVKRYVFVDPLLVIVIGSEYPVNVTVTFPFVGDEVEYITPASGATVSWTTIFLCADHVFHDIST